MYTDRIEMNYAELLRMYLEAHMGVFMVVSDHREKLVENLQISSRV